MTVLFANSYGQVSTDSYSGPVEIVVSGTGNSQGPTENDAFYQNAGSIPTSGYYQLTLAFNGGKAGGTDTDDVVNDIEFDNGVGFVSAPYRPAYSASHTYDVVLDVATAGQLTFAVADGIYGDNAGQYDIQIYQLVEIPEPSGLALAGLALVLLIPSAKRLGRQTSAAGRVFPQPGLA